MENDNSLKSFFILILLITTCFSAYYAYDMYTKLEKNSDLEEFTYVYNELEYSHARVLRAASKKGLSINEYMDRYNFNRISNKFKIENQHNTYSTFFYSSIIGFFLSLGLIIILLKNN